MDEISIEKIIPPDVVEKYKEFKKKCETVNFSFCNGDDYCGEIGDCLSDAPYTIDDFLEEKYGDRDNEFFPEEVEIYLSKEYYPNIYIGDDLHADANCYWDENDFFDTDNEDFHNDLNILINMLLIKHKELPSFVYMESCIGTYDTMSKELKIKDKYLHFLDK